MPEKHLKPVFVRDLTARSRAGWSALRAYREVVLDLSGVELRDCSGLGAIVHAHNQADRTGGRLLLCGAGPRVLRLLRLIGLDCDLVSSSGSGRVLAWILMRGSRS